MEELKEALEFANGEFDANVAAIEAVQEFIKAGVERSRQLKRSAPTLQEKVRYMRLQSAYERLGLYVLKRRFEIEDALEGR